MASTGHDTTSSQFCPSCSVEIPADAAECPHCHRPAGGSADEPQGQEDRGSLWRYLDNRWILLAMLFFVSAGLGLPFLWKSRAFGLVGKLVLTAIMLVYTGLIVWAIYLLLAQIYGNFRELYEAW